MSLFRSLLLTGLLCLPTVLADETLDGDNNHTGDIEGLVIGDSGSILGGGDLDLDDLLEMVAPIDTETTRTLWYAVTPTASPLHDNGDDANLSMQIHRAGNNQESVTTLTLFVSTNLTLRIQEHFVTDPATETRTRTVRIIVNNHYVYNPAVDGIEVFEEISSLVNRELEAYYGAGFIGLIRANMEYEVVTDIGLGGVNSEEAISFYFFAKFVECIKLFDDGRTQQPLRVQYYVNRLASDLGSLTY